MANVPRAALRFQSSACASFPRGGGGGWDLNPKPLKGGSLGFRVQGFLSGFLDLKVLGFKGLGLIGV